MPCLSSNNSATFLLDDTFQLENNYQKYVEYTKHLEVFTAKKDKNQQIEVRWYIYYDTYNMKMGQHNWTNITIDISCDVWCQQVRCNKWRPHILKHLLDNWQWMLRIYHMSTCANVSGRLKCTRHHQQIHLPVRMSHTSYIASVWCRPPYRCQTHCTNWLRGLMQFTSVIPSPIWVFY